MAKKNLVQQAVADVLRGKRSIRYLRVSSRGQMDTDAGFVADGNSIDSQRKATVAKEESLGITNVGEYIEPGNSGQSIEGRPEFKKMMKRIIEQCDVDYVVIDMRSRAFRNYTDAAITKRQLAKLGVKLISAREDFGQGIMADAMEAVTDIMNEVQVRMSGEDIRVKMGNKAINGGTIGRAKVGYLNERTLIEGRKVNTIVADPERAPFVRLAFELFATGRYTTESLHEHLTDVGFMLPATSRWPKRPISESWLQTMLRDRYYQGDIFYGGVWRENGRHEPLVTRELFDRVQRVLDSHSGAGTRQRTHHHYLKGLLWCATCKRRFVVQRAKGNGGEYFYFLCRGKQDKICDQPYVPVEVMEEAVAEHYARAVWLPADFRAAMRTDLLTAVAENTDLTAEARESLARRVAKLDQKEDYFLDLAADEGWPKDKLRTKLDSLRDERRSIKRTIQQAEQQLATGRAVFEQALDLLDHPQALYATSGESVRVVLNKAFFAKLYVEGRKITGHDWQEPFDALHSVYEIQRDAQAGSVHTSSKAGLPKETGLADRMTVIQLLSQDFDLGQRGWSSGIMVGDTGIEPVTSTVSR